MPLPYGFLEESDYIVSLEAVTIDTAHGFAKPPAALKNLEIHKVFLRFFALPATFLTRKSEYFVYWYGFLVIKSSASFETCGDFRRKRPRMQPCFGLHSQRLRTVRIQRVIGLLDEKRELRFFKRVAHIIARLSREVVSNRLQKSFQIGYKPLVSLCV